MRFLIGLLVGFAIGAALGALLASQLAPASQEEPALPAQAGAEGAVERTEGAASAGTQ